MITISTIRAYQYFIAVLLLLTTTPLLTAQSPLNYRILKSQSVLGRDDTVCWDDYADPLRYPPGSGPELCWDSIVPDPANHRLFIARLGRIIVVDENNLTRLGEIEGVNNAHRLAIADHSGHGFAIVRSDPSIVMFDLKTFKVLDHIPLIISKTYYSDAIIYDSFSNQVFAFSGDTYSSTVTVIDPADGKVIEKFGSISHPLQAVSDGNGKIFVRLPGQLVELNAKTHKWVRQMAMCQRERGLPGAFAIDIEHHLLYNFCGDGEMVLYDYDSGHALKSIGIEKGTNDVAFDPNSRDVFASNADGWVTVIHDDDLNNFQMQKVKVTGAGLRSIALDTATHRLFASSEEPTIVQNGASSVYSTMLQITMVETR